MPQLLSTTRQLLCSPADEAIMHGEQDQGQCESSQSLRKGPDAWSPLRLGTSPFCFEHRLSPMSSARKSTTPTLRLSQILGKEVSKRAITRCLLILTTCDLSRAGWMFATDYLQFWCHGMFSSSNGCSCSRVGPAAAL